MTGKARIIFGIVFLALGIAGYLHLFAAPLEMRAGAEQFLTLDKLLPDDTIRSAAIGTGATVLALIGIGALSFPLVRKRKKLRRAIDINSPNFSRSDCFYGTPLRDGKKLLSADERDKMCPQPSEIKKRYVGPLN